MFRQGDLVRTKDGFLGVVVAVLADDEPFQYTVFTGNSMAEDLYEDALVGVPFSDEHPDSQCSFEEILSGVWG